VLAGSVQMNEHLSLGVEGRAAWLTSGVAGGQIDAMTAGGIVSACGHYRWFFGCGIAHLGVIKIDASAKSFEPASFVFFLPGGGVRAGFTVNPTRGFVVRGSLDVLGLSSGITGAIGQTEIVRQPPILIGAQVAGGWEF